MKSHLIIQGPIISHFTSFCHPYEGPEVVSVNGQLAFDSSANVLRIAREYRERFDTIVLATWDNEPLKHRAELESLGVVLELTPLARLTHVGKKWRQVVGVLAGLKAIPSLAPDDRVTKTRTDVWFDVPGFIAHAEHVDVELNSFWREAGQLGFIHAGNSRGPYFLEDMFFSSRAGDFVRMWEASSPERHQMRPGNIHMSLPIEYAWRHRRQLQIPTGWFRDFYRWMAPWHTSDRLFDERLWRFLLRHCFCLAPEIAEAEFIWRGRPSSHCTNRNRLKRFQFYEQWLLLRDNEKALSCLTDLSYFNERRAHSVRGLLRGTRDALRARWVIARDK